MAVTQKTLYKTKRGFLAGAKTAGKELRIAIAEPAYASRVVTKAFTQATLNKTVERRTIPKKLQSSKPNIASGIAAVPALAVGPFAGIGAGSVASLLPKGKARDLAAEHPLATVAVVAATVLAPAAVVLGVKGAVDAVTPDGQPAPAVAAVQPVAVEKPPAVKSKPKRKRKKAKRKPKRRRAKRKPKRRKGKTAKRRKSKRRKRSRRR